MLTEAAQLLEMPEFVRPSNRDDHHYWFVKLGLDQLVISQGVHYFHGTGSYWLLVQTMEEIRSDQTVKLLQRCSSRIIGVVVLRLISSTMAVRLLTMSCFGTIAVKLATTRLGFNARLFMKS